MCDSQERRIIAMVCAADFTIRNNETYRLDCFERLGVSPDDEYPLVCCKRCGFLYAAHLPSTHFLAAVYDQAIDHNKTITESISYRRELLEKLCLVLGELDDKPRSLLDFGCGYGHALRILNMRDLKCVGYDVSVERLARAGLTATSDIDELRKHAPFDVILCFDVLEHVPFPNKTLELLASLSCPETLLAINVPDMCGELSPETIQLALKNGRLPRALNLWEHLNYFAPSNFHSALAEHGFVAYRNLTTLQQLGFIPHATGVRRVRNVIGVMLRTFRYKDALGTSVICHRRERIAE